MAQSAFASLPLAAGVHVLKHHPCGLLALEKPAGVLSHPNIAGDHSKSLLDLPYELESRRYHGFAKDCPLQELFLVHRLDAAVTGVILLARTKALADVLRERFAQQKVEKTYYAIVKGHPPTLPPVWIDRLHKTRMSSRGDGPVRAQPGGGSAAVARTGQSRLRGDAGRAGLSLLRLSPQTGRTHQLRVQCSIRGHPILGDRVYGDFKLNRTFAKISHDKRLFLHAASISLTFQFDGGSHTFEAQSPLPESFDAALLAGPALIRALHHGPDPREMLKRQQQALHNRFRKRGT